MFEISQQAQTAKLGKQLAGFIVSYGVAQVLWLLSWWFIGRLIFQPAGLTGVAQWGWLVPWATPDRPAG